jgi:hypothetical protein
MKYAVAIGAVVWLLCGLMGAGLLGQIKEPDVIARGPITLILALQETPPGVPINN